MEGSNLKKHLGKKFDSHIKITENEKRIPFTDDSFDVVYANQVFEHIKFIDAMFAECARVLKTNGILLINFPLATYPLEGHLKIPFAHWIPPGRIRVQYLRFFYVFRLRPKVKGLSALQTAVHWERYLREKTYYRFMDEIIALAEYYFNSWEIETGQYIRAKIDLLRACQNVFKQSLSYVLAFVEGKSFEYLVTHFFNAAFFIKGPKKVKQDST